MWHGVLQMAAGTPMSGGFQMVPAEVFGSGAQQAFVPGPMMMGMGYPLGMRPAMVKPVRRPITIQAPPDAQAAAGAFSTLLICNGLRALDMSRVLQLRHHCAS